MKKRKLFSERALAIQQKKEQERVALYEELLALGLQREEAFELVYREELYRARASQLSGSTKGSSLLAVRDRLIDRSVLEKRTVEEDRTAYQNAFKRYAELYPKEFTKHSFEATLDTHLCRCLDEWLHIYAVRETLEALTWMLVSATPEHRSDGEKRYVLTAASFEKMGEDTFEVLSAWASGYVVWDRYLAAIALGAARIPTSRGQLIRSFVAWALASLESIDFPKEAVDREELESGDLPMEILLTSLYSLKIFLFDSRDTLDADLKYLGDLVQLSEADLANQGFHHCAVLQHQLRMSYGLRLGLRFSERLKQEYIAARKALEKKWR